MISLLLFLDRYRWLIKQSESSCFVRYGCVDIIVPEACTQADSPPSFKHSGAITAFQLSCICLRISGLPISAADLIASSIMTR